MLSMWNFESRVFLYIGFFIILQTKVGEIGLMESVFEDYIITKN
jgi:hypothetical protein